MKGNSLVEGLNKKKKIRRNYRNMCVCGVVSVQMYFHPDQLKKLFYIHKKPQNEWSGCVFVGANLKSYFVGNQR